MPQTLNLTSGRVKFAAGKPVQTSISRRNSHPHPRDSTLTTHSSPLSPVLA